MKSRNFIHFAKKPFCTKQTIPLLTCLVFTVTVCAQTRPTISAFSPASGPTGTTVTITGTGFNATPASNIVYFSAVRATVTNATATSLTVTVPAGAAYGPIQVLNTAPRLIGYSGQSFVPTFANPCGSAFSAASLNVKVDFATNISPVKAAICDVDGDGRPDLTITNSGSDNISVLRNTTTSGSLSFAAKVDYVAGDGPQHIVMADLDNDGKPDMAVSNVSSNTMSVWRNISTTGAVSFATKADYATGTNPGLLAVGDMDADGRLDLLVSHLNSSYVSVFRNTSTSIGSVSFAAKVDFATGSTSGNIATADVDGDGKTDMVIGNPNLNTVSVLRNTSSGSGSVSFAPGVDFATGLSPRFISLGDLDSDGKPDLVTPNLNANTISILRNTSSSGSVSFATRTDYATATGSAYIAIGDVDGDSRPDLVATNNTGNVLSMFRNTSSAIGSISLAAKVDFATGTSPRGIAVGDLNADNQPDLVVANGTANTVSVLTSATISSITAIAGANTSSNTVCNNGVWKTLYNSSGNAVVAAVKDNGQNLGTLSATVYVDAQPGTTTNGQRYMARHYKISATTQPSTPVRVRLYFTDAELQALRTADPTIQSIADIGLTKYSGTGEDGTIDFSGGTATFIPNTSITAGRDFGANYVEFSVTSFSEFWIHGGASALPVKLTSFTAAKQANGIVLRWTTAQEQNADRFIAERSSDGLNYTAIGSVAASGTTNEERNYTYTDAAPLNGLNFYRLQQVDIDGQRDVSKVISVRWGTAAGVQVVMSHTGNRQVQAHIDGQVNNGRLELYDGTGRKVKSYLVNTGSGRSMRLNMDLGASSPGVYLYRLITREGRVSSGKIVLR